MIGREGTFDYVVRVPQGGASALPWTARLREPLARTERRLVGHAPRVELEEFEPRTGVARTRITLKANDRRATAATMSFCVDRALTRMLRADDEVHVSRTGTGGIGLSVLRAGELVGAVGAVTSVPLGEEVVVGCAGDLVHEAESVLRKRDPNYHVLEYPVEVRIGGETRLLHRARIRMGRYEIFVVHGFLRGMPGTDESVAISLIGVCADCAASLTAPLLGAGDGFEITGIVPPARE